MGLQSQMGCRIRSGPEKSLRLRKPSSRVVDHCRRRESVSYSRTTVDSEFLLQYYFPGQSHSSEIWERADLLRHISECYAEMVGDRTEP